MKVLHISTSDSSGGAARAAYRVHSGLRQIGVDSTMFVQKRFTNDPTVIPYKLASGFVAKMRRRNRHKRMTRDISRYTFNRAAGHELFSDDRTEHGPDIVRQLPACDLINLHWVAGFLDYESFFAEIPPHLPIFWRLADMAPVTGGCHYDGGCGKFATQCGRCPQLSSDDPVDLSQQIFARKRRSLQQAAGRLQFVATSKWIAGEAKRSAITGEFPVTVIPNGLNTDDFSPRDRKFARESLGIPQDADVVLFVAESADVPRKGYALLCEAIKSLANTPNLLLLSMGAGNTKIESPIRQIHVGKVSNDRMMSIVYSAADVFVMPSVQESFGQTVIESLACGTPVVGFDTGGIPDMVRPGITGQLAPVKNVAALRDSISSMFANRELRQSMAQNARKIAEAEYSLPVVAKQYLNLYESALSRVKQAA